MLKKCIFILLISVSSPSHSLEVGDQSKTSKTQITKGFAKIIIKMYKRIPLIINESRLDSDLLVKATASNDLEKSQALEFIKNKNVVSLPKIELKGMTLSFKEADINISTNIGALLNNKFFINGQTFVYDNKKSFNKNFKRFEILTKKKFSLLDFILPSAYASAPLDNLFLAVVLLNNFEVKRVYDTGKKSDLVCHDEKETRSRGLEFFEYCKRLAKAHVENNTIFISMGIEKEIRECRQTEIYNNMNIDIYKDYEKYVERGRAEFDSKTAPVIRWGEEYGAAKTYITVAKLQYGDKNEIKQVDKWIEKHFYNKYQDDRVKIRSIKTLSCKNLVHTILLRTSNIDPYEQRVNKICKNLDRLKACHKRLYKSVHELRSAVNDRARKENKAPPENVRQFPAIRTLNK